MTPGIACPYCTDGRPGVIDSRPLDRARRRRYVCSAGHRFTTLEVFVETGKPVVVDLGASGAKRIELADWLARRTARATTAVKDALR